MKATRKQFVTQSERKRVARPQPPMGDRRTKRSRDRGAQRRRAIDDAR